MYSKTVGPPVEPIRLVESLIDSKTGSITGSVIKTLASSKKGDRTKYEFS